MSTDPPASAPRAAFREVSLCVLGIAQLYNLHPAATVSMARALADVFRAWLPGFVPPPLGRGRGALLVLADALRAEAPAAKANPEPID
jgi:hypothetical protein